jgi:hypothetical protein
MPRWGEVLREIDRSARQRGDQGPDLDGIRLGYIQRLHELSGRAVISYASGWLRAAGQQPVVFAVEGGDVHGLMEVCHEVEEDELDLVLHSPGGSPEAAEQMLDYLRSQFRYIRALVPLQAKSAATMLALGCDEIVMGLHSELGPIDPQILVPLPEGVRYAPAHAILRDFQRAKAELAQNLNGLAAWTPILRSYAGGLIEFCNQQVQLAQEVVASWLARYMLAHPDAGVPEQDRDAVARSIAEYFGSDASYERFRTHGRPIRVEELEKVRGLVVRRLEADDALQDAVLSIYHATDHTFGGPARKIVENHIGRRWVRIEQIVQIGPAQPPAGQSPKQPTPPAPRPAGPNRADRRRQKRGHR